MWKKRKSIFFSLSFSYSYSQTLKLISTVYWSIQNEISSIDFWKSKFSALLFKFTACLEIYLDSKNTAKIIFINIQVEYICHKHDIFYSEKKNLYKNRLPLFFSLSLVFYCLAIDLCQIINMTLNSRNRINNQFF